MGRDGTPPRRDARGLRRPAAYLQRLGIDVDLAPVLDTPASPASFLGSRAFSRDPKRERRARDGVRRGPAARRRGGDREALPGPRHGARVDRHEPTSCSTTSRAGARARASLPFARAIDAGVKLVMVSNAGYPAYDPTGVPAVISRPIVTGLLRERLGFRGVVISDAMEAPGPERPAARRRVRDRRRRRRPALRRRGIERRRLRRRCRRGEERNAAAERAEEIGGADRGAQALARPALS